MQKLDVHVTRTKHSTSHFLIDNFCTFTGLPQVAGFGPSTSSASCDSFASSFSPASRISNRPCPRLETPVTHRKQTIAPISNRPQFSLCKLGAFDSLSPTFNLGHPTSRTLIANDLHSRKESSTCKQSTYQFLIANEFHLQNLPHQPNRRALPASGFRVSSNRIEIEGGGKNG